MHRFFLDGLANKTDIEIIKNYAQKNVDCTESIRIKGYGPNNIAKDDQYLYLASLSATPLLDILKMPEVGTVIFSYGTKEDWVGGKILSPRIVAPEILPYIDFLKLIWTSFKTINFYI